MDINNHLSQEMEENSNRTKEKLVNNKLITPMNELTGFCTERITQITPEVIAMNKDIQAMKSDSEEESGILIRIYTVKADIDEQYAKVVNDKIDWMD